MSLDHYTIKEAQIIVFFFSGKGSMCNYYKLITSIMLCSLFIVAGCIISIAGLIQPTFPVAIKVATILYMWQNSLERSNTFILITKRIFFAGETCGKKHSVVSIYENCHIGIN